MPRIGLRYEIASQLCGLLWSGVHPHFGCVDFDLENCLRDVGFLFPSVYCDEWWLIRRIRRMAWIHHIVICSG